jgi:hypothetical protein
MAKEKEEKDIGELCHISVCKAENGWKVSCSYKCDDSLSVRAGWIPAMSSCKDFVEKSKSAVVARVKQILDGE